ncbi:autotransporter outer membrane beta-barrel domain-containing protein [Limnobaculum xujianqingii]|nr:autotransporter outer membrane beta-barrel domain-containing protein [Limnobaculum xujianqingii]
MYKSHSTKVLFQFNAITLLFISTLGLSTESRAACKPLYNGPDGAMSSIVANSASQCTYDNSLIENNAAINSEITQVSATGVGSKINFTADSVNIINHRGNNSRGVYAYNGGEINFAGDLNIQMKGDNPVQNYGILLSSQGTVNVANNLSISGNFDNSLIYATGGTLNVGGDTLLTIGKDDMQASTGITTAPMSSTDQIRLNFNGKTEINHHPDPARSTISVMAQGDSIVSFNELKISSSGQSMDLTVSGDAAIVSRGTTTIDSDKSIILNVNAVPGSNSANGIISLGEDQNIIEEQLNNRNGALVNIGSNANITSSREGATGIRITSNALTPVTNIIVKGLLDVRNGNAIAGNGVGAEHVTVDGGQIYGIINMDRGDDIITANSGVIDGEIIMGRGSDTLILNQGIDISNLKKANGHDPMFTQTDQENNQLEANGLQFTGYTSLAGNSREGTNFTNWDSIALNNGAALTMSDNLFESTETRERSLFIDATSSLIHQNTQTAATRTIYGNVENNGQMTLSNNGVAGDILTISGDYKGDGGVLLLDTVLNSDDSLTDKLVILGDAETGTTNVVVNKAGGDGALTDRGIEIITVEGLSEATFKKMDNTRIVAGQYEYELVKKDNNWYLTSEIQPITPVPEEPEPEPEGPTPPTTPDPEPKPEHQYRPESGSYMANQMAANTLFITRLHDRLGETQYTDMLTGEEKVTSMWMRHVGGHNRSRDGSGQLKTQSNRYIVQLGGDIAQWSSDGADRWHVGLMTGYANQHSNTRSKVSRYSSDGSVDGYSAGIYGTWYANEQDKSGSYVDSWVLYNWFDNTVKGEYLESEKYKSRGVTASIEAGYTFKLGERESDNVKYFLQPKAQLIWMNVRAKDHVENNGTRISSEGDGNLMTRLGLRAYMHGHHDIDNGKDREFEPFIEANWIHNTRNFGVTMNDVRNEIVGTKNIGEIKVGVEAQWSKQFNMWTNVGQQIGDNGYSDTQAMVGFKYLF